MSVFCLFRVYVLCTVSGRAFGDFRHAVSLLGSFFFSDRLLFVMYEYLCVCNNYPCTLYKFVIRLVGFRVFFNHDLSHVCLVCLSSVCKAVADVIASHHAAVVGRAMHFFVFSIALVSQRIEEYSNLVSSY